MDQRPLDRDSGSVAIEFLLVMPLLLMIFAFVLQAEVTLRSVWTSLAAARVAAWCQQRIGEMPAGTQLIDLLHSTDPRIQIIDMQSRTSTSSTSQTMNQLEQVAEQLAAYAPFAARPGRTSPVGIQARCDLRALWGQMGQSCYLDAYTWRAEETGASSSGFQSLGDEQSGAARAAIGGGGSTP